MFILLLSSFSESQQNENKFSSLLINKQTGADAFSAILIFKSSLVYTSARPPPLPLPVTVRRVCRQHCDRNRCSP